LGLGEHLEKKFEVIEDWTNFNYKSHVLGMDNLHKFYPETNTSGTTDDTMTFGRVNHFQWMAKNNNLPIPTSNEEYNSLIRRFQDEPLLRSQREPGTFPGFTYAYPNHFSQNILSSLLRSNLK